MKLCLKDKKGLSTVVTTLIILVVSVLLATVVTYYAINVVSTRVQEESLYLTKFHVWYNTTGGWAEGAFVIVNTGGRDVVIDKIAVRGQESTWSNVYFWKTNNVTVSEDLQPTSSPLNTSFTTANITVQGAIRTFSQATDDLTLKSGWTMVVYINSPDSITVNDVGTTVGVTLFTATAQYYKETNIESV
jgi:hypothetical protein